jgi:glycosyltransferase involved in cell wall biosynthesis
LLLKDPILYEQFRERAFQTASEKFNSASIVLQYEDLYYRVAGLK